ncbi:RING-H2 finger protein ATL8-like [Zingiber officinale]|uniref:RING-type domain-containing protein n=1 Tax=Zingiber officinale TaxID=94328 RepID=A0A8J5H8F3_ZINOF|nr:RING-H2 finger protein ATL8-like [Zingiber officinale]KAG6522999.1 hypothetical protein ZIOFF_020156 [Zingiber officinale]
MRSPARFLLSSEAEPPSPLPFDSDVVVILAVLLCALICVVGLALFARCAWLHHSVTSSARIPFPASPNKGLKMKVIRALPTLSFNSSSSASAAGGIALLDCPICLAEFSDGELVRVLPQCGHGFHAKCVDTWFRSQSSCPTCRRILAVAAPLRCHQCGANSGAGAKLHDGGASSTFLP